MDLQEQMKAHEIRRCDLKPKMCVQTQVWLNGLFVVLILVHRRLVFFATN